MQAVLPAAIFANSVAFLIATVFSYFINTKWSFSCILYKRNFLRFILVSFIGFFVTIFISRTAQYYGLHYGYGIAFVVFIVPPVTFFLHNIWTYR
jgi:putative flippase GtrA